MPSKSRAQKLRIPHAGLIGALGLIMLSLGMVSLIFNFLNPANWAIGFIGLFYGPAAWQYITNIFLIPIAFWIMGFLMMIVSVLGR